MGNDNKTTPIKLNSFLEQPDNKLDDGESMPSDAQRERALFLLDTAKQFLQRDLLTPDVFAALSRHISSALAGRSGEALPDDNGPAASPSLVKTVKTLIRKSGLSLHQLGQKTDIDPSQLSRFLRGQRDLSLGATERLCTFLQMRFSSTAPAKNAKKS